MDKRVQRRLKRDELDNIMKNYPALNKFLEEATDVDSKNLQLKEILEPVVEDMLKKARLTGVKIGYLGCIRTIMNQIESCTDIEEIKKFIEKENKSFKTRFGIK